MFVLLLSGCASGGVCASTRRGTRVVRRTVTTSRTTADRRQV